MEKSDVKVHESDTSSVITMKEYAPSEYPSSEPPPAYMKPRSNALRIAKLAAFTVIVSSIILGGFMFAASWIQARATRNLDLTLNQELLDELHPSYDHLIGNDLVQEQVFDSSNQDKAAAEEKPIDTKDKVIMHKNEEGLVPPPPPEDKQEKKSLDLDDIANMLMQRNIRGNINCIVEKRRNEELVDHAPMSLNLPSADLPFGLNITTPPRLQHLTGEQMIVICKGDEDEDKEDSDEEEKAEPMQTLVFPLPQHMMHQIQQVPQIVPIARLIQQLPIQQPVLQPQQTFQQPQIHPVRLMIIPRPGLQLQRIQVPIQQQRPFPIPMQPFEQNIVQQPEQPIPIQQQIPIMQQIPFQQQIQPEIPIEQQIPFQRQVRIQPQQAQPQQILLQKLPQIIPIREVRLNDERIPLNHILHNRVPVNPLAVNDVPISRMPITHMPIKTEVSMEEEPVPVHHLVPPQPQQLQVQNFNQEEPRPLIRPVFTERFNRIPFIPQQQSAPRMNPEIREPRLLRIQDPMPKMRFPVFPPRNMEEPKEPSPGPFADPADGPIFPIPSAEMKAPLPLNRPQQEQKVLNMFPIFDEPRRPLPPTARRIRFPESSEEVEENRLPIITEITKIIPIRIEREESQIKPDLKNNIDEKLEKVPERPFPIPINAILDMIFRGIRPLLGNRLHNVPVPIDIKIERIEKGPLDGLPMFKKLEMLEKEIQRQEAEESDESGEPADDKEDGEKDMVEAKVERVELENGMHPIPIPVGVRDAQIFKIAEEVTGKEPLMPFENRAFLPNGQGRGARVFPIPQQMREAEIFSVSDARSGKNMDIEIGSSFAVEGDKEKEGRQGRGMSFPVEGEINPFHVPEGRAMKPLVVQTNAALQKQNFNEGTRSVQLYPVEANQEQAKPQEAAASGEDIRPHYVQPRSV